MRSKTALREDYQKREMILGSDYSIFPQPLRGLFQKKWLELLSKSHWDNYRVNKEVNNENTKLWAKMRRNYDRL
jgi:hypothetical protein